MKARSREWMSAAVVALLLGTGCGPEHGVPDESAAFDAVPGAELGDAETLGPLFQPRALLATAGGLWVLDAGNRRVLLLGQPSRSIGRSGAGPGEFKSPVGMELWQGGGTAVFDAQLQRLTFLGPTGEVRETRPLEVFQQGLVPRQAFPLPAAVLSVFDKSADALNAPEGELGTRGVLARVDPLTGEMDTVSTFPLSGPVVMREPLPDGGVRLSAWTPAYDAPPHADVTAACGGFGAVSAGGRDFRIHFVGPDGRLLDSLNVTVPVQRVTQADRERYFGQFDRADVRRFELRTRIPVPDRHAAVQELRLSSDGHLWVRTGRPDADPAPWLVWPVRAVGAGSVSLGNASMVHLPRRFSVQDTRGAQVWGFELDSLDTPRIRSYRLPTAALPATCAA
jgi:hypothetical protein